MSLTLGTMLGPYEIVAPLGTGHGRGIAPGARFGRDVAINVPPAALTKDANLWRRFEQEARPIAALSCPNILGIHDIGVRRGQQHVCYRTVRSLMAL